MRLGIGGGFLKFGSYCQVAEDVTPRNSLAARTRGAMKLNTNRIGLFVSSGLTKVALYVGIDIVILA